MNDNFGPPIFRGPHMYIYKTIYKLTIGCHFELSKIPLCFCLITPYQCLVNMKLHEYPQLMVSLVDYTEIVHCVYRTKVYEVMGL